MSSCLYIFHMKKTNVLGWSDVVLADTPQKVYSQNGVCTHAHTVRSKAIRRRKVKGG